MALLAAWLGLPGALLALGLGLFSARWPPSSYWLSRRRVEAPKAGRSASCRWGVLCIGGIVSSLWGSYLLSVYYRWAGF